MLARTCFALRRDRRKKGPDGCFSTPAHHRRSVGPQGDSQPLVSKRRAAEAVGAGGAWDPGLSTRVDARLNRAIRPRDSPPHESPLGNSSWLDHLLPRRTHHAGSRPCQPGTSRRMLARGPVRCVPPHCGSRNDLRLVRPRPSRRILQIKSRSVKRLRGIANRRNVR